MCMVTVAAATEAVEERLTEIIDKGWMEEPSLMETWNKMDGYIKAKKM